MKMRTGLVAVAIVGILAALAVWSFGVPAPPSDKQISTLGIVLTGVGSLAAAWAAYAAQHATRVAIDQHEDRIRRTENAHLKRAVAWAVALNSELNPNIELLSAIVDHLAKHASDPPKQRFNYVSDVLVELSFATLERVTEHIDDFDVHTASCITNAFGMSVWLRKSPRFSPAVGPVEAEASVKLILGHSMESLRVFKRLIDALARYSK